MSSTRDHELVWGVGGTSFEYGHRAYAIEVSFDGDELAVDVPSSGGMAIIDADTLAKLLAAAGWKVER